MFTGDPAGVTEGTTHVLVTHGHNDHFGDTIDILKRTGATLVTTPELGDYVESVYPRARVHSMNPGGTREIGGITVSCVRAHHSSSLVLPDGSVVYGGEPTGLIAHIDGERVYHMGDTCAFGDMALIEELHHPTIGPVPVGDNYTMGQAEAALAVNRWFNFRVVIPMHYATFPVLDGDARRFASLVTRGEVRVMEAMGELDL
jgi:L-ascorbate metabolism protein UlaG (beta-lactamase superfamily)